MKKLLLLGIGILVFFGLIDVSNGFIKNEKEVSVLETEVLVRGFEASHADFHELNINSTLSLPNEFITMELMDTITEELIEELSLKGKWITVSDQEDYDPYFLEEEDLEENTIYIHRHREDGYNQITVTTLQDSGRITVFKIHSTDLENQKESYIIIDIVQNKEYKEIDEIIAQHKEILVNYGEDIDSTATLVGTIAGNITGNGRSQWLDSISNAIKAETIDKVSDNNFVSMTLFTKEISRGIPYGNKRMNLQLASTYNQYEDKTYLWIATPLITYTY